MSVSGVTITYTKFVHSCEECDHSDYDGPTLVCCSDKLPKRYLTRHIDDNTFTGGIPKWCPYKHKPRNTKTKR